MSTLLFVAAFCVVAVLVYMARYSGRLNVTQTRLIDAPIDRVYAMVADCRQWAHWSPWLAHSPGETLVLSGQPDAVGGGFSWDSERGGSGQVEQRHLAPYRTVEQQMRLKSPFAIRARSLWSFASVGAQTEVTWTLRGRVAFSMRAFAPTLRGAMALECRAGLDRMASQLEPATAARYDITCVGVQEVPACRYVYETYRGPIDGLPEAREQTIARLQGQLAQHGIAPTGPPVAVYVQTNVKLRRTVCHIGIPVNAPGFDQMPVREMPAHQAYAVELQGTHSALEVAWYRAMQSLSLDKLQPDQRLTPFERYTHRQHAGAGLTGLYIPLQRTAL
ncbi:SRPBCC family protein [Rhodoferax saidenbachensis]|uniref:Transcriptional regulator YdeE/uncharacterized protein YndB with AHSA1/START domain n=1 Tax=Rhodoferax saidenbachensis TaxID=1484693 RepID=A0ABU1ZPJ5_9BURK|nr:SRPBCC family protein [Rhodoferax saidenbachensis]MDR7307475.1 putative transcriptional regulator YdeE/uncharacterized protein YndB with AHSA1/START domain [Rhodoferax saidenbachensis]